jgi:hypothetical protein
MSDLSSIVTAEPKQASRFDQLRSPAEMPHPDDLLRQRIAGELASLSLFGTVAFFAINEWTIGELLRVGIGLMALWFPFAGIIFLSVRTSFDDLLSRLTFSAIASYSLTTLTYFCFSVCEQWAPGALDLFYVVQILAVIAFIVVGRRQGLWKSSRPRAGFSWTVVAKANWPLALLVVLSLLANTKYKHAFATIEDGSRQLVADGDQTYFVSIAHELSRRTPPAQQSMRAGVPDRAYHIFPHLTTMLVGRYTGQDKLLRAHLAYEYTVIDVLTILTMFCFGRSLTGSAGAGLVSAALTFIGAVPLPPMIDEKVVYFYFNLWPHASSNLEPMLITSPQMYSGLLVWFGVLLGVTEICRRASAGRPSRSVLLITSLLIASLLRFRVQIFLPEFLAWLLLLAVLCRVARRPSVLLFGAATAAVAALLVLEMRSPGYLPGTSELSFGNSKLVEYGVINAWPGAADVDGLLARIFPMDSTSFAWCSQIVHVAAFSVLVMIGLPLLAASVICFWRRSPMPGARILKWHLAVLVAGSIAGAVCISATYDRWSVGGQMLLNIGWYLFPLTGPAILTAGQMLGLDRRIPRTARIVTAAVCVAGSFTWQLTRPPSDLAKRAIDKQVIIDADEWAALTYIRESLPPDAVLISNKNHGWNTAILSGVGGRRAYLEYIPTTVGLWKDQRDSDDGRIHTIKKLWDARDDAALRESLPANVTHVIEYDQSPLSVRQTGLLKLIWRSPKQGVSIWQVER